VKKSLAYSPCEIVFSIRKVSRPSALTGSRVGSLRANQIGHPTILSDSGSVSKRDLNCLSCRESVKM